jgi:hypothetical protein
VTPGSEILVSPFELAVPDVPVVPAEPDEPVDEPRGVPFEEPLPLPLLPLPLPLLEAAVALLFEEVAEEEGAAVLKAPT